MTTTIAVMKLVTSAGESCTGTMTTCSLTIMSDDARHPGCCLC